MWWRPESYAEALSRLRARRAVAEAVRQWFGTEDFLEVETPALQISPGLEPHLNAFAIDLEEPFGQGGRRLYLHTSPEFTMKKLLVAGLPRIFQLARVFRNGERAPTHHPEFTMLEWYRAEPDWRRIVADCEGLLRAAVDAVPPHLGNRKLRWNGHEADPHAEWEILTVEEAFRRHAGIDLLATAPDPSAPDAGRLAAEARSIGIAPQPGDLWDDIFFRIFLDRIEPKLGIGRPTVLYGYPASMAALARIDPEDPRVAQRFEVYVCGLELANAFVELTDAEEQRRRFEADMDLKERLYGYRYPIDEDFLAALSHGMPPSAGIALGFDRLVMLATGAERIEDVLWAPVA